MLRWGPNATIRDVQRRLLVKYDTLYFSDWLENRNLNIQRNQKQGNYFSRIWWEVISLSIIKILKKLEKISGATIIRPRLLKYDIFTASINSPQSVGVLEIIDNSKTKDFIN